MNVLGIQIVGILFGLCMFYITFLHKQRKNFTSKEYVFWIILWISFIILSVFPASLDYLIKDILSLHRRIDFFIITGFMFILGIIFYIYTVIRKIQKKIEKFIRNTAIKEAHKPTNKEVTHEETLKEIKNEDFDSM